MTERVVIPCDEKAEWMVVALAVGHPADARAAVALVSPDEFYRPALGAALMAAGQMGREIKDEPKRVHAVAEATGLREVELSNALDDHVGPVDRWTRKVRAAPRRRRVMALAGRIYNEAPTTGADELTITAHELITELESLAAESDLTGPSVVQSTRDRPALGHYLPQQAARQS